MSALLCRNRLSNPRSWASIHTVARSLPLVSKLLQQQTSGTRDRFATRDDETRIVQVNREREIFYARTATFCETRTNLQTGKAPSETLRPNLAACQLFGSYCHRTSASEGRI